MTMVGEFASPDGQESGDASYPSIFGVQLSPQIIGALVAVLGLAGSVYLFMNFVQPVMQQNDETKGKIAEAQSKLDRLAAIKEEIALAEQERDRAKQELTSVTTLFANPNSLNTLLLDLNKRIEARNSNLPEDRVKARLVKFEPDTLNSGIISDGSLGPQLNGKLYRQSYTMQLEGTFDQIRLFLIDLERQKSLAVVKEYKSVLSESTQRIAVDRQDGKIVPIGNPETKILSSFKLQVLRPLTAEELARVAPAPATPSPGASPTPTPAK